MIKSFACKDMEKVCSGFYSKTWNESIKKAAMLRIVYTIGIGALLIMATILAYLLYQTTQADQLK